MVSDQAIEKSYWMAQLAGEVPVLKWPADLQRKIEAEVGTSSICQPIEAALWQALQQFTEEQTVLLEAVLLSAYHIMLAKYSGQEDLLVGIAGCAGVAGADALLPLRSRFDGQKSVRAFVAEIQERLLSARAHGAYSLGGLLAELQLPQLAGDRHLLLETALVMADAADVADWEARVAGLCVAVLVVQGSDEPFLKWVAPQNASAQATVERMHHHVLHLLQEMMTDAERAIGELDMLLETERVQLLETFQPEPVSVPQKTVVALFEEQAAKTPDAVAIVCGDEQLTYGELNERAGRLANVLRGKGVQADSIVGILIGRTVEMAVAIWGVLKAGAAYVPIDPSYPQDRIAYMLEDSRAQVLVTHANWRDTVIFAHEVIDLAVELDEVANEALVQSPRGEDLAYVIYTSGTTGRPKGVAVEHRHLMNTMSWRFEPFRYTSEDGVIAGFSYSFDGFVVCFFPLLLAGGKVVLLTEDEAKNPLAYIRVIQEQHITIMVAVPSLYRALLDVLEGEELSTLRIATAGGEKLDKSLVEQFKAKIPGVRLINEYGPTENTVTSVINFDVQPTEHIAIGQPVPNMQAVILDRYGKLVPLGSEGELCMSGAALVRGYLHRPELTAERFVPHPYFPGQKMYRTGDLAKWDADGNLYFLGRIDHQIKVRGYRVEAGEIEYELNRHAAVRQAVVVGKQDAAGRGFLCAYLVTETAIDVREMRDFLARQLPEFMIPSYFVELDAFPMTPNGKVDIQALPEPEIQQSSTTVYEAPRTETEKLLAELWSEALGVEQPSIHDDFFLLGGHSLKAMVMLAKIRQQCEVEITLKQLFDRPTIVELAAAIETTTERRGVTITKAPEQPYYPASSAQKRMYALAQFAQSGTNYNLPSALVLEGQLEVEQLHAAFGQLVQRHESLRTEFDVVDGEIVQRILPHVELAIETYEVTAAAEPIRAALDAFVRPFDLHVAPLLRVGLALLGDQGWLLMIDWHHIIADGVSASVFMRELMDVYAGQTLEALPLQYKDYAVWQQAFAVSDEMKRQAVYWLEQFAGEIPVLQLPTDFPRPAVQDFAGASLFGRIERDVVDGIKRISRETGATLYMVLMCAYNILLAKYSGQEDVVVGTVTAGRPHADLQALVGMFVGTLAMRSAPTGSKTVRAFLDEVKVCTLDAFDHADYPFETLLDALRIPREPSRHPLFDTVLVLENMDIPQWQTAGLTGSPYLWDQQVAKFDLTLVVEEAADELAVQWEYRTSLFAGETVERMHQHFVQVLREMVNGLDQTIGELEWLTAKEKAQLLHEFQTPSIPHAPGATVVELFEQQVQLYPEQAAVVFRDEVLSYQELNRRANALAHVLRSKGAQPNDVIGLLVAPAAEMLVGILGILKSGAAYVPIDPEYPDERVLYMLQDSEAKLLLTQKEFLNRVAFAGEVLDLEDNDLYEAQVEELTPQHTSESLAYVIYTSGSTGQPKGVMIEHHSLLNLCLWHNELYQVTAADRATKYAGFGFDASVWEVFPYLVAGATLHVIPSEMRLDVPALNAYYEQHGVTISFLPTQICEQFMLLDNRSLRVLMTGGDKLRSFRVNGYDLYNNYGPSENTVVATAMKIEQWSENIPIGKPINGTRIYILDRHNRFQPVGVEGELCIAGKGIARGYRNKPEMTAEKFVADPFVPGERMYRSGDRARWLADGTIQFLGRMDTQVKIRGYRIELGEIEQGLLQHESVQEAIVLAKADAQQQNFLCAYVVQTEDGASEAELKAFLAKRLADYMVPAYIVRVVGMPLTPNGKVDTKALPDPKQQVQEAEHYEAPRYESERCLASVWQDVLAIERVGIQDHFYALGGDSIKAIQVSSRIQKYGYQLDVKHILQFHTIAELAPYMKQKQVRVDHQRIVEGTVAWTPIQTWFMEKPAEVRNHFNQSMMLHRAAGFDFDIIERVFTKLVEHHDALRLIVRQEANGFVAYQRGVEERCFTLETFDLRNACDVAAEIEPIACSLQAGLDIEHGPLVKLGLFHTANGDELLIVIHHLVVDGVSWRILLEDVATAYEQAEHGEEIVLPSKTIAFQDWANLLLEYAESESLLAEHDFWASVCEQEVPPLPKRDADAGHNMEDSRELTVTLSTQQTETLLKETNQAYNTEINDLLLTALTQMIQDETGNDAILIHLESHGREAITEDVDTTRTVGWFTSMYPVVLKATTGNLGDAIKQVKESLRKIPNKGIGYGVLRYLTKNEQNRLNGIHIVPEISFNFLGQFDQTETQGLFQMSQLPRGNEVHGAFDLGAGLAIEGIVLAGQLQMSFHYSPHQFAQATVEKMAERYKALLLAIADHCAGKEEVDFTPSDFSSSELDFDTLQAVFDSIGDL